ncbi:MAG: hypothetical protein FWD14_01280, partial [Treponema sp.]|nr:hypothetical protein [Treponema sp.]
DEDIEGNIELYDKITAYLNPEYMMSICFNYEPPAEIDIRERELINIKKDLSWNIEGFGIIELENEYLCYAMHELSSHNHWAYQDILNIKKILTEIRITSYGDEF